MEIDYTKLPELLAFLVGPIGIAAWMLYVSNAFRNLRKGDVNKMAPSDQELAARVRKLTPLQFQAVVTFFAFFGPIVAGGVLEIVPAATIEALSKYYSQIATVVLIYIGQQVYFQATKDDPAPDPKSALVG